MSKSRSRILIGLVAGGLLGAAVAFLLSMAFGGPSNVANDPAARAAAGMGDMIEMLTNVAIGIGTGALTGLIAALQIIKAERASA